MAVIVPLAVTGDPLTLNIFGNASPTLVTVPEPAPVAAHVPSPRKNVDDVALPLPRRAVFNTPLVTFEAAMFGVPLRLITGVEVAVEIDIVNPATELFALTDVTVPAPAGTAHVPSPRQNVPLEALVPELRFVTGRFPVTSLTRLMDDTVLRTPPVAFTHPDEVNLPICFPVVLEKIAAWPTEDADVSEVTSPDPLPPVDAMLQFHARVDGPVCTR